MKNLIIILILFFAPYALADNVELFIKKPDGSIYWHETFKNQADGDSWLATEKSRQYWNPSYVAVWKTNIDPAPPDNSQALADRSARITQIQTAIANWSTLTAVQKDTILKLVLTHLANQ